ncbi:MFS transporter [Pseudonocardia sp. CA-107938]|uniref:MFS transporter n=1 Tax=Pseudonocardia sp. CA-107938 TaxID=3240021 RepID=UPI003D92AE28
MTGTSTRGRVGVLAITLGIFTVVTTEILPIGLLVPIGRTFDVTDGTAGLTMFLPGLLAAGAAPLVTVAAGRADRRRVLLALAALLAGANVLAALAAGYGAVLVSRVLLGVVIGGFWAVGVGLAPRLVPPRAVPAATALIFSAVPLGSVLGVPAGTLLATAWGWRAAFAVLAVLSGVVLLLLCALPALPPGRPTRPATLRAVISRRPSRAALAVTVLVVAAHFGAYTYVTPFLEQVTQAGPALVTAFLLVYGAAGVVGSWLAARRPGPAAFGWAAALLAAVTVLLPPAGGTAVGALVLLAVWGIAYGAVPVCSQAWFAAAAPDASEAASVLFTASFQATIALGALAGGAVLDATSLAVLMPAGGAVAAVAVLVVALAQRSVAWTRCQQASPRRPRAGAPSPSSPTPTPASRR